MKNIATLAVAATLALAGCAGTNGASGTTRTAAAPAAGATSYCIADRLDSTADGHNCNWAATAKEACESRTFTTVRKANVAEGPSKGGMCQNGNRLVYVTTK